MQVRTGATTCVTSQTDGITSLHFLILLNQLLRHVGIIGLQAIVMADDNVFAIALGLILHDTYLS